MNRGNVTALRIIHQRVKEIDSDNQNPYMCVEEHMLLVNGVQNSHFIRKKKKKNNAYKMFSTKMLILLLRGMRTTPCASSKLYFNPQNKTEC